MPYVLQQLLSQSVRLHPDKLAVSARGKGLTYHELEERSNQLAHFLRQRGVKKGDRIGLYSPKRAELVAAMFGVVKAGGVYVPLDPQAPVDRISYIIDNCGIKGLVTCADKMKGLNLASIPSVEFAVLTDNQKQNADHLNFAELSQFDGARAPEIDATTTDLAYILYTSGSTGTTQGRDAHPSKCADFRRVVRGYLQPHQRRHALQSRSPALRSLRVRYLRWNQGRRHCLYGSERPAIVPCRVWRNSWKARGFRSGIRCPRP